MLFYKVYTLYMISQKNYLKNQLGLGFNKNKSNQLSR